MHFGKLSIGLILMVCLSIGIAHAQVIPYFQAEEWSGSATFIYTVRGPNFYSELKHTATISKGIGTAQTTYHYTSQSSESSEKGSAQGEGPSSINIGFTDDPPTYSISLPVPAAIGTRTVTYKSGAVTSELGQEESSIMISDQKLPKNPDNLSGKIEESSNQNGERSLLVITWNFYRGASNVDLIVVPKQYDTWLPVPGKDENTPGSKMSIYLELIGKDKKPPRFEAKQFFLELKNTSHEPGLALNAPLPSAGNSLPDIRFLQIEGAVVSNQGQTMQLISGKGNIDSFLVGAFDGGGRTTLMVEALLENGERIQGQLEIPGGSNSINIPKRNGDSRIALSWLRNNGNPSEDEDEDTSPGNNNHGDGLSVFEEYRGVMAMGAFLRLDPKRKDLFVRLENGIKYQPGLSLLGKAAGINVISLNENELSEDRVINKNSSDPGRHIQHGLLLVEDQLPAGVAGENQPIEKKSKTPKYSERVVVDPVQLQSGYDRQLAAAKEGGVVLPFSKDEMTDNTIAHELAHGIGLDHHGPPSMVPGRWIENVQAPEYHIFDSFKKEYTKRPVEIKAPVGDIGCESSGDLSCIMTYTRKYNWVLRQGPMGSAIYNYFAIPLLPEGNRLCTSAIGTGINANGYFGNATTGDCKSKLKVRD